MCAGSGVLFWIMKVPVWYIVLHDYAVNLISIVVTPTGTTL